MYEGLAQPTGRYASRLEERWAQQFAKWGWDARYVGDECSDYDFDVGGVRIEIKPDGEEYVREAAARCPNILVIEGAPGRCRWWFVDYVYTAIPMDMAPRQIPYPGKFGTPSRMETPQELLKRSGFRFE